MNFFSGKLFTTALLFIILLEVLSFTGYLYPEINTLVFFVIVFFTLILSLKKLEYGIYILLAELFIGSKGYLFSLPIGDISLSIRIALFLIIMSVWLYNNVKCQMSNVKTIFQNSKFDKTQNSYLKTWILKIISNFDIRISSLKFNYWLLFLLISWGFLWGLIRGNSFDNIFFDFNSWLYFLLIFPLMNVIHSKYSNSNLDHSDSNHSEHLDKFVDSDSNHSEHLDKFVDSDYIYNIFQIFSACIVAMGLKTLFLLYAFSHYWLVGLPELYSWVRDTGVGEITQMNGNFYRIFFQSHVYSLIGTFIFLAFFLRAFNNRENEIDKSKVKSQKSKIKLKVKSHLPLLILIILSILPILISLSRSFWVGGLAGLAVLFCWIGIKSDIRYQISDIRYQISDIRCWLKKRYDIQWLKVLKLGGFLIGLFVLELGFIWGLINVFKPSGPSINFASMVEKRVITSAGEAAGKSRINLLKPLFLEIAKHPIIGSGFGTTVTYRSTDPRALARDPEGWYTTYAFEWGYLDIWLKMGLVGLLAYLYLIWKIIKCGLRNTKRYESTKYEKEKYENEWGSEAIRQPAESFAPYGLLLGLIALLVTNIFSPYLNHPLGIGYILLCSIILEGTEKEDIGKV